MLRLTQSAEQNFERGLQIVFEGRPFALNVASIHPTFNMGAAPVPANEPQAPAQIFSPPAPAA